MRILETLVTAGVALALATWLIQRERAPTLEIQPEPKTDKHDMRKFVHVIVRSVPMKESHTLIGSLLSRLRIEKDTAYGCRSYVTVRKPTGETVHENVHTKWVTHPEPLMQLIDPSSGRPSYFVWPTASSEQIERIDIDPGDEQLLDIAVKHSENNGECYLNNFANYVGQFLRNPNNKVDEGEYSLEIQVRGRNAESGITRLKLSNVGRNLVNFFVS